jgi:tRNA-Thr(GGU) m(6)t(6)A37 methyltransferase TsaA
MKKIGYKPIGIIHSPFQAAAGTPIQGLAAKGKTGSIEIFDEYAGGLLSLGGFSHIIVLYHFHLARKYTLTTVPFLDDRAHGIFATRAPARPNPIGLSVLPLLEITPENLLIVANIDILDGTPLLDIKPYVPAFDQAENVSTGWLGDKAGNAGSAADDGRFGKDKDQHVPVKPGRKE